MVGLVGENKSGSACNGNFPPIYESLLLLGSSCLAVPQEGNQAGGSGSEHDP